MTKFVFDNCCFCVDLRVGCFIIGYLNLIGSAIGTLLMILMIAGGAVFASSDDPDEKTAGILVLAIGIVTLLIIAFLFAFALVLVIGLHKHKPGHIKAYLIYSYIFLLLSLIMLIVNLSTGPYDAVTVVSRLLGLTLSTYFILVIRSYYYQMREGPNRTTQYNS